MTKHVDLVKLADTVKAARERLGLTQQTLASVAGVSQATVSRIESRRRGVTAVEADRIAGALDLPLETLLYGSDVPDRVLVALRSNGQPDEDSVGRAAALAEALYLLELDDQLDTLVDDLRQPALAIPFEVPQRGGSAARGRELATRVRAALSLGQAPITDVVELIEALTGVDVATRPVEGVSGLCLVDPARATRLIMVNNNSGESSRECAERQRFTLAHELGHVLFNDGARIDTCGEAGPATPAETRCNEFARNLLIPVDAVKAWMARSGIVDGEVGLAVLAALARHFQVSTMVVKIQLERAGWAVPVQPPSTARLASLFGWRAEYDTLQDASRKSRSPQRLVERATKASVAGKLSSRTLAHLQGRKVEDVESELRDLQDLTSLEQVKPRAASTQRPTLTADQLLRLAGRE